MNAPPVSTLVQTITEVRVTDVGSTNAAAAGSSAVVSVETDPTSTPSVAASTKQGMPHLHDNHGTFVVVEANMGAGKTEFVGILSRMRTQFGKPCEALFEPVGDPIFARFLQLYYEDPKRWGLTFQMYVLQERLKQHTLAAELAAQGRDVIQDRSIYADGCFGRLVHADGNMSDDEWEVYARTFGAMKRWLRYPDVMVYLKTRPETCYERMKVRARSAESGVPLEYLQRVHEQHEIYAQEMARYTRVLVVDYDKFGVDIHGVSQEIDRLATEDRRFIRDWRKL